MEPSDVVARFYGEIWNRGELSAVGELCHPDMTFRGSLGQVKRGADEFTDYVRYVRGALDGYECVIEELVAEGDRVFAKMLFRGVHRGPFEGFEPTGRRIAWSGAALFRIAAGRIRDLWVLGDRAQLHAQLRAASGD